MRRLDLSPRRPPERRCPRASSSPRATRSARRANKEIQRPRKKVVHQQQGAEPGHPGEVRDRHDHPERPAADRRHRGAHAPVRGREPGQGDHRRCAVGARQGASPTRPCSRIRAMAPIRSLRRTSSRTPMASTSAVAAAANRTLAPNAYAKGAIGALRPSGRIGSPPMATSALDRISIAAIADTAQDLAAQAREAEAAGIDCVWTPELFRSSVTQATWIAAATERIGVGTGIAWAFTRSPFILAVTALDLDEMSGGRFRLGLGAGVKRLNETWHGVDYGRPGASPPRDDRGGRLIMQKAPHRRADPLRGLLPRHRHQGLGPPACAGSRVGADLHRGGARGHGADGRRRGRRADRPPDVLAALARRGAGGQLRGRAWALGPRSRSDFDFIPTVCCAISDDEEAAYEACRRTICFYATVRTYAPLWEMHGFGDAAVAGRRRVPVRRPRRRCRPLVPTRWSTPTARRGRRTRSEPASRRSPSGATACS